MTRHGTRWVRVFLLCSVSCGGVPVRTFPDRPVAWQEHDDENLPSLPEKSVALTITSGIQDFVAEPFDRRLALRTVAPAADVNALDEVPCSTWFCPRNHLAPLSPAALAAGPDDAPALPLRVIHGKSGGASRGFVVLDARGQKYLVKLDPKGHPGLATGAEVVSTRLVWAAGYQVPGAFRLELSREELLLDPHATYKRHGYDERPLSSKVLSEMLAASAESAKGRWPAVAVAWIPGQLLGPSSDEGTRQGDANDRIPHEDRRSLRASWLLFAWLNVADAGPLNTLDSYVGEGRRRFVRHYLIDFGASLGSWTTRPKPVEIGSEPFVDYGRSLRALVSLGLYQRSWQEDREEQRTASARRPRVGWLVAEGWDPATFRTTRPIWAHQRMTPADAYFGAKLVTSFSDAQLHAAVAQGGYSPGDAHHLEHALAWRRDAMGRRYLTAVTALEHPTTDGTRLCFTDVAITRGYLDARHTTYRVSVEDAQGHQQGLHVARAVGPRTCVPMSGPGTTYRWVTVQTLVRGSAALPTRVHLRWRPAEGRMVVVGVERGPG